MEVFSDSSVSLWQKLISIKEEFTMIYLCPCLRPSESYALPQAFLGPCVSVENQRMVYWRGNSAENQDTNGKLGPKPYRERYHPGMDAQCGRSGWLAGSRSERCLTPCNIKKEGRASRCATGLQ